MRMLIAMLAVILFATSPVNKSEAKRNTPLWIRREHYNEEAAWCGIFYDSERVTDTDAEEIEPDPQDVEYLACVIYCEAGSDTISDETRRMVGDVVLNRVDDPRFPNTIEDVLLQKSQYGRFHWTGIVWPSRANSDAEKHAVDRAYRIAKELLTGEHSALYGQGYIWQAEFQQGSEQIYSDGIYFGR